LETQGNKGIMNTIQIDYASTLSALCLTVISGKVKENSSSTYVQSLSVICSRSVVFSW